jgi:hypothetical protein
MLSSLFGIVFGIMDMFLIIAAFFIVLTVVFAFGRFTKIIKHPLAYYLDGKNRGMAIFVFSLISFWIILIGTCALIRK